MIEKNFKKLYCLNILVFFDWIMDYGLVKKIFLTNRHEVINLQFFIELLWLKN